MSDGADLVSTLRHLIKQTGQAGYPANWFMGVVETVKPLSIRIDQKELLPEAFFWLTDAVRDHDVDIEVSHVAENRAGGGGMAEYASHNHEYKGRKKIRVYNGLHVGEKVLLLQQEGGQRFVVLSRLFNHTNLQGQWL